MWDGFGLWLALHDPRAVRLLFDDDVEPGDDDPAPVRAGPAAAMFPVGTGYAGWRWWVRAPGWPWPGRCAGAPLAAGRRVCTRSGRAGRCPAERLLAALAAWDAAGRPRAAGLQLVVVPRPVALDAAAGGGDPAAERRR